ncbi:hypothetical protein HHI36_007356 [Cryptolaemus montrouzieri]|uniref:PH domain-containing protein n=1 Tax=Cryptolaemus montrouzieri TaxID=559131 RepID=A0ABD2MPE0_9CUCU
MNWIRNRGAKILRTVFKNGDTSSQQIIPKATESSSCPPPDVIPHDIGNSNQSDSSSTDIEVLSHDAAQSTFTFPRRRTSLINKAKNRISQKKIELQNESYRFSYEDFESSLSRSISMRRTRTLPRNFTRVRQETDGGPLELTPLQLQRKYRNSFYSGKKNGRTQLNVQRNLSSSRVAQGATNDFQGTSESTKEISVLSTPKKQNKLGETYILDVYKMASDAESSDVDKKKGRKTATFTPICKSTAPVESAIEFSEDSILEEKYFNKSRKFNGNSIIIQQISCGSTDNLETCTSSSFCCDDSISDLVSKSGDSAENSIDHSEMYFEVFNYMREKKNEECSTIEEIKKVLKILRGKQESSVIDTLLQTERNLLISTEKCKAYILNMTNHNYLLTPDNSESTGTITISKIMVQLKNGLEDLSNVHFVCVAVCDVTVIATKYVQPEVSGDDLYLIFDEEMVFNNLEQTFQIDIKIFCIHLRSKKRKPLMEKKVAHPVKLYFYQNRPASSSKRNYFLHSGFKQCGEFKITLKNIRTNKISNYFPEPLLDKTAVITKNISNLRTNVKNAGYLYFGQRHVEEDAIIWNNKYVVLEESHLKIYNTSDISQKPLLVIDVRNVVTNVVGHTCHLKYCFHLEIVYEENEVVFKLPYYLRAKSFSEYKIWLNMLNCTINILKGWDILQYMGEFNRF